MISKVRIDKRKIIRLIQCSTLAVFAMVLVFVSCPITASATEDTKQKLKEAQEQRQKTQSELDEKKSGINSLSNQKNSLQGELTNLNDQLTDVSDNLSDIEKSIADKQTEIDTTQSELDEAVAEEEKQYESMKKRVQFIYEQQSSVLIELFLECDSFADFLNRSDYVSDLSSYDRKMLEEYKATKATIEAKQKQLDNEIDEMNAYKVKAEAEQSRISGLVSKTSGNISTYSGQISAAEKEADAIEDSIDDQDKNINELQKKLAEEMKMSKLAADSAWRNISEISFADGDRTLLANLIYCEAGNQPYEGKLAVGAVVINRVLSTVYPSTVVGVIYQNRQFSPVASGRLALALARGDATDSCYQAADEAMGGATNVGECVYFRTPIEGLTGIQIGGHIFY